MIQAAIGPLSNILSGASKTAVQSIQKLQGPAQVLPSTGINNAFQSFFKFLSGGSKVAIPQSVKTGASTITRNIAITSGFAASGIVANSLFLSTPQGQRSLDSLDNFTNLGGNITDFLSKNPIVPIGLIILGGLIVVSVIKK